MKKKYDLIVIGGGVLGTFHAYHALRAGLSVLLLEKNTTPSQASVRNFGQVVPSGMDRIWQQLGIKSLGIYKDLQQKSDITVRENGTVYIASNDEELQLLEELAYINRQNNYLSQLLTTKECLEKYPGLKSSYAKGALFFPEEITVEPRQMVKKVLDYLTETHALAYQSNALVTSCNYINNEVVAQTAAGDIFYGSKAIICNGSDFKVLYPQLFAASNIEVSKLQLMQTVCQPKNYQIKGSILTGLSIRRYESFQECPSYKEIKSREENSSPASKWGIHILFKQASDGSIILGDSHQYASVENVDTLGFDVDNAIEECMLDEAKKIFELPDYTISHRWLGFYSQCKGKDVFEYTIDEHIHIVTGIGGKGMTGSPGFSEENIRKIFGLR